MTIYWRDTIKIGDLEIAGQYVATGESGIHGFQHSAVGATAQKAREKLEFDYSWFNR